MSAWAGLGPPVPVFAGVLCAGAAAWVLAGGDGVSRRARLVLAGGGPPVRGGPVRRDRWVLAVRGRAACWREWICLGAGLLVAVLGGSVVPLLAGAAAVPLVRRWLRGRARERARVARAVEVAELCGAVVGELRAGSQPGQALTAAMRRTVAGPGGPGAAEAGVLAAAAFGGDVPGALRQAAREPGAEGLAGMAACWRVSVDGGAGLAAGLDRLEGALRAERDREESLRAQLAGARSTAVVLALLPLVGLLIGTGLGADPLRVLLHTPVGWGCLLAGGVLEALGLLWCGRIVRAGGAVMGGFVVHRLGMTLCLAVAALCVASAVVARVRARAARRRIAVLLGAEAGAGRPALPFGMRDVVAGWAGPCGALLAGWVLVGGVSGVVVGALAAFGVRRWRVRARPPAGVDQREAERQLPFAADLLAACLAAGAGPVEAAEVVGESLGGPLGERLARAGAELRLGGEPGAGWGRLAEIPGARPLADCLERAARTGAPAAEPVSRLASHLRADRSRQAGARGQRAAVLVTAPVGLCFLPAFLAIGVAPVVIGMASGLLSNN